MTRVDRVAPDTYRIATMLPDAPVSYNQFLIDDEHPALVHTGFYPTYPDVREAVAEVLDPASIAYIVILHFEADECGAMQPFASGAPGAQLVCSELSTTLNLSGWDYDGPIHSVRNGDTLELGTHRLQFFETPHVHHWDSMMVYDATTDSLFPSDLFIQPGEQPPVIERDLGAEMCELYRGSGVFADEEPVLEVVDRLESLELEWLHPMHGGSIPQDLIEPHVRALRDNPFAYEGRLFGREVT